MLWRYLNSETEKSEQTLLYNAAVTEWITSCHKFRMVKHVIMIWREHVTSLPTFMSTMPFPIKIMPISMAIKASFNGHMICSILHDWSFK